MVPVLASAAISTGPPVNSPHTHNIVRNALAFIVCEAFWGFAWSLSVDFTLAAPFSDGFGGSEAFVGTVMLVSSFSLGIPTLLTAFWVEPMRHKRQFVFWTHIAGALVMGLMAVLIAVAGPSGDEVVRITYLVGMGLFFAVVGFTIPGWLAMLGELFPKGMQARVLAITFILNKTCGLGGGDVTRIVLGTSWSAVDQWTFLFGLAAAMMFVGSFTFLWIVERPLERPERTTMRRYVRGLVNAFRDLPMLRRFIATDLLAVTAFVTIVFYPDAAIRGEGFPDEAAGTWIMIGAVFQLSGSGLVAWAGHRVEPRQWLAGAALTGALCSVAAAVGGSPLAYAGAAAFSGLHMGLRNSCYAPHVMQSAPDRDGTAPLGIALALAMIVQGVAPFLVGALVPDIGYGAVFLAVAACCVASALLLAFWLPRVRGTGSTSFVTNPD